MKVAMVNGLLTETTDSLLPSPFVDIPTILANTSSPTPSYAGGPLGPGSWSFSTTEVNVVSYGDMLDAVNVGTGGDPLFGGKGATYVEDGSTMDDVGNWNNNGSGHTANGLDVATPNWAPRIEVAQALQAGNENLAAQDMTQSVQRVNQALDASGPLPAAGNAALGFLEIGVFTSLGVIGGAGLITASVGVSLGLLAGGGLPVIQAAAEPLITTAASLLTGWLMTDPDIMDNNVRAATVDMVQGINAAYNYLFAATGRPNPNPKTVPLVHGDSTVFVMPTAAQFAANAAYFHQGYTPGAIDYVHGSMG